MGLPQAIHLPDGNYFDDMRLDIAESIRLQEPWLGTVQKRTARRSLLRNYADLAVFALAKRLRVHEFLVNAGLQRRWFDEFVDYWRQVLDGRSLSLLDFHQLRFLYRTKSQRTQTLNWDSPQAHLKNWHMPSNVSSLFHYVYKSARFPITSRYLPRIIKKDMRILEYGCSMAPMYGMWRRFFSHIPTRWVLADIANFPFHYARHVYGRDLEAEFVVIEADLFDDPLKDVDGKFDLIVVREVFEHLDRPRYIAEYLMDRLVTGGLFYFGYLKSDAVGLDTVAGLEERLPTLEFLSDKLEFVLGSFHREDRHLDNCVGRKK